MVNPQISLISACPDWLEMIQGLLKNLEYRFSIHSNMDTFLTSQNRLLSSCILLESTAFENVGRLRAFILARLDLPPVVVCAEDAGPCPFDLLEAGAYAACATQDVTRLLPQKVNQALQYHDRSIAIRERAMKSQQAAAKLTSRQTQIIQRMIEGKGNRGIATDLDLSLRTVEHERASILRIFNVANAVELAHHLGQYQAVVNVTARHAPSSHMARLPLMM